MSKENLRVVLEKRANDKIEREKQIAIEAKEQERKRIIEAQKQEQDIIDRENMRKDKEALAQRKSTVEQSFFFGLFAINCQICFNFLQFIIH
jgi:hypothetical protein